jgi:hypothetical protein
MRYIIRVLPKYTRTGNWDFCCYFILSVHNVSAPKGHLQVKYNIIYIFYI